jgi:hypothetical protein
VKEQLRRLEELQAIDLRIRDLARARDAIPAKVGELLEESRRRDQEVAVIEAQVAELERERGMLESQAQEYQQKIQKALAVQAEIKNQKEYEAVVRELDGYKKHRSHFEEEVLRSMELLEQLGRTRTAAREAADQARQAVEGDVAALEAQMADLGKRIAEEEAQRGSLAREMPPALLKRYDQIRGRRLGLAVARVQDGVCGGCNMNLPPQLYNVILRLTSIEQCPSCQRILVYRPAEAQAGAD